MDNVVMLHKIFHIFYFFPMVYALNIHAEEHVLLVEKQAHQISLFRAEEMDKWTHVKSYPAITGKAQGNKITRGDKKTPEGIYFITGEKDRSTLFRTYGQTAKQYGPMAFVLNYPNAYDSRQGKTGSGIWIHGVESNNRLLTPYDTRGCVALSNNDIKDLTQYIENFQTFVVITDKITPDERNLIFTRNERYNHWLETWRAAWEASDYEEYSSFYSDQFFTKRKNKEQWIEYKKQISEVNDKNISISVENPKALEFKDQLVISFIQKYSSSTKNDVGRKFLYLQKEGEVFRIIAEDFYPIVNSD